jgi:PAS domain S-box-containing protein
MWIAIVVGGVYLLSAKLSLALLTPEGVAVFWPAAGVAAGALIALGPRARLAVVIGTMVATVVANLLGDRTLWGAIVFALCNAGEAVLTAGLIERYFGSAFSLDRLRQVLGLLAAAIAGAAVSGIGGTFGFIWFHDAKASIPATWQNWVASDALGIITVAPLLIGLASVVREPPPRSEAAEGFVALATLVIVSTIVILLPSDPWKTVVPIVLLFPLILWIAARCRPVFAAAAAFIVTLAIVWTTTVGIGHFGDPGLPMADRVLGARAGILIVALCAYVLAALFAERRQHEAALMESEARVQETLTAGAATTFIWDVRNGSSQRSANAAKILGFEPEQTFTAGDFLARVHPDDRERYQALVRGVRAESPAYTATFRFKRPDGADAWLEEIATAEFDAMGRFVRLNGLTLDVTARKQSDRHQGQLAAEHDGRVENLLGRIATIVADMRRDVPSVDQYAEALQRRIRSMADIYALLSQDHWHGTNLTKLVRHQLAPYATDANTIINGQDIGQNVELTAEASQVLAMVLHELAANASEYGALSTPHGRVEMNWNRAPSGDSERLFIEWREFGGRPIAAPPKSGYGLNLIRDLVQRELGGAVAFEFASAGVCCKIEFPLQAAGSAPVARS